MSHNYTDEYGYPLKAAESLRWYGNKRKPVYVEGKPSWAHKAANDNAKPAQNKKDKA